MSPFSIRCIMHSLQLKARGEGFIVVFSNNSCELRGTFQVCFGVINIVCHEM